MRRAVLFLVIFVVALGLSALLVRGHSAPRQVASAPGSDEDASVGVRSGTSGALDAAGESLPDAASLPDWVHVDPRAEALCPDGMVLVDGSWCPFVGHRCIDWIDQRRDRCRRYSPKEICEGRLRPLRFCIDRYEYPNLRGVLPAVMMDFTEAAATCRAERKRLCKESEWTFACEGEERFPYPHGYVRDGEACNIDRPTVVPDFAAFDVRRRIADEVARLDQRVASGTMPRCVSPFGVYDMTGNVDEWVVNERGRPDVSGLKGGYYGRIRARCRPITTFHNRWFRFYQVGFRCCSDPLVSR